MPDKTNAVNEVMFNDRTGDEDTDYLTDSAFRLSISSKYITLLRVICKSVSVNLYFSIKYKTVR